MIRYRLTDVKLGCGLLPAVRTTFNLYRLFDLMSRITQDREEGWSSHQRSRIHRCDSRCVSTIADVTSCRWDVK